MSAQQKKWDGGTGLEEEAEARNFSKSADSKQGTQEVTIVTWSEMSLQPCVDICSFTYGSHYSQSAPGLVGDCAPGTFSVTILQYTYHI
jgi:hypothetical protein